MPGHYQSTPVWGFGRSNTAEHTFALPNIWFGHGVALGSEGVVPKAAFGVAHDAGALGLIEGRAQFLSPYWSHQTMPRAITEASLSTLSMW